MKPEVRKLSAGAWVVDYGPKWFRVRPNGEIIAREPTPEEVKTVRSLISNHGGSGDR